MQIRTASDVPYGRVPRDDELVAGGDFATLEPGQAVLVRVDSKGTWHTVNTCERCGVRPATNSISARDGLLWEEVCDECLTSEERT